MSDRAMPLLFLNLGGEMLYVIDQRLYAQKIPEDKGKKSRHIQILHAKHFFSVIK